MIEKWFGLKNHVAVVAGSSGLLGRSCVAALKDAGAHVIGVDVQASQENAPSEFISLDLTEEKKVEDFFATLAKRKETSWSFIHTAYPRTANWGKLGFENVRLEDWDQNSHLQMGSCFLFNREAVKLMKARGGGSIVNFSSIYGLGGPDLRVYEGTPMDNPAPYSAIKAGVVGLTRYIAAAYGPNHIRANVVAPGGIENGQPASFVKAYESRTPMRRMGKAQDIGGVVAFLVSPAAAYVSGTVIPVDGGWTSW